MKFKDTMMHDLLKYAKQNIAECCLYTLILRFPVILLICIVGIPCAIVADFFLLIYDL